MKERPAMSKGCYEGFPGPGYSLPFEHFPNQSADMSLDGRIMTLHLQKFPNC